MLNLRRFKSLIRVERFRQKDQFFLLLFCCMKFCEVYVNVCFKEKYLK